MTPVKAKAEKVAGPRKASLKKRHVEQEEGSEEEEPEEAPPNKKQKIHTRVRRVQVEGFFGE